METQEKTVITVEATVNAPVDQVWEIWTNPEHIVQWNAASEDWHTIKSENDLREGGKFSSRMEAKDGSFGFDFEGIYDKIKTNEQISYTMPDGRKVNTSFVGEGDQTVVRSSFDAENTNPVEMQKFGWQSIMNNFKAYVEKI